MVIFIILFGIFLGLVRSFVYGLIVSSAAVYSILAVCIFIAVALMFLPNARHWGTIGLVATILCFVAYDVIAAHPIEVVRLITFVVSFVVTFFIKRAMWNFVHMDAIRAANGGISYLSRPWMRWLVRLV